MKRTLFAAFAAAIALTTAPVLADGEKIAFSVPSLGFPFFVHMQNQFNDEASAQGVEVINYDGQNQTTKQTADVEAAIISGVDGLVISPIDSVAMAPAVSQAVEAGVPVITIDRRVDGVDGLLGHVGADNVKGGEAQGELIIALFPVVTLLVEQRRRARSAPGR